MIPLALFILVGLLALAIVAARLTGQSATSATLEGLSTQAFYAAESGGQYGMNRIFYGTADSSQAQAKCAGLTSEVLDFSAGSAVGLRACRASVTCEVDPTSPHFYVITSQGSCGAGEMSAQRTIQISAAM